jgi:RNA polymerase sigma-70 factor (ECF subfamily)
MDVALSAPEVVRPADDASAVFSALIGRELDGAYRLAAVILGDALEAEDAVSDAAVSAWAGYRDLRDPLRFPAWFGRILVNGCRDRLRRRRRVGIVDLGATLDLIADPDRRVDVSAASAERDAVARALGRLEPDHQVILVLRFWLDLPLEVIAERLGIPLGTAKSRLHNAGRRLRQILDDEADR